MTIKELKIFLDEKGIPEDVYDFKFEFPNEALCINFNGQKWETYYSERGIKTGLKIFEKEEQACEYLYPEILKYGKQTIEWRNKKST